MKRHRIAKNLKALRLLSGGGVSQQKLVNLLGDKGINISRGRYEAYENDRNEPDIDTIKVLADYYCITIEQLCYSEINVQKDI